MARKNVLKMENAGPIHFDTRTKAVMAEVVQDNIKEKVSAVREVVPGKSNNEIILVLQYYDYNVEKSIQAYLEDGAKSALTEWQCSKAKVVKKKRTKKNKASTAAPQSTLSSSETGSTSSLRVNGDIGDHSREPLINGVLDTDGDSSPLTDCSPSPLLNSNHIGPSSSLTSPPPGVTNHNDSTVIQNGNHTNFSSQSANRLDKEDMAQDSSYQPAQGVQEDQHLKHDQSPPPPPQQSQHQHSSQGQRPRNHSGSHSSHHSHSNRHRTNSASSTGAPDKGVTKKPVHLGLEKSVKDLHRQTVSLERLKLVFSEEVDKSYKRLKAVFDELRACLNSRELELMKDLDQMKESAKGTFQMRQNMAADLKVRIDRAERLKEEELTQLRTDVKHFVSDRKVDEDLGRTTRFLYDDDHLMAEIKKFGEVVPVKCAYIARRPSIPSSVASTEPDQHNSLDVKQTSKSETEKDHNEESRDKVPHLAPAETHEIAELQRRLKNNLQLGGIPVKTYPEKPRPTSAPVISSNTMEGENPQNSTNALPKRNRNPRRRPRDQDRRDRPDDRRDSQGQGQQGQGPNRPNYSSGEERVVLIGRGTRQQGSFRPPRGGGRGRGGYYRGGGRGRGGNPGGRGGSNSYRPQSADGGSRPSDSASRPQSSQNTSSVENTQ